jgi:restriction endonuclease S subunit
VTDRYKNRSGFKKAKFRWLPKEWETPRIKDIGQVQAGRQRSPHFTKGDLRPYLRVANIFEGYIDASDVLEMKFTEAEYSVALSIIKRTGTHWENPFNVRF